MTQTQCALTNSEKCVVHDRHSGERLRMHWQKLGMMIGIYGHGPQAATPSVAPQYESRFFPVIVQQQRARHSEETEPTHVYARPVPIHVEQTLPCHTGSFDGQW